MSNAWAGLPYLVCEIANSHAGDEAIVRALIAEFAALDYPKKGIKFQVFQANALALPDFESYSAYQELEFGATEWCDLIASAAAHGDVWIDVFDRFGTEIIKQNNEHIAGLKLQSSVLENEEVLSELKSLSLTFKALAINVSGFELEEIKRIIDVFDGMSENVVLQIGFQSYPTKIEDTALQKVAVIRSTFPEHTVGLADHADATSDFAQLVPIYASLLGCSYLEKHLCLCRDSAKYDSYSALEPDEMKLLCKRLTDLADAVDGPFVGVAEKRYLDTTVQIPVLRSEKTPGARIDLKDLVFRRTSQPGITWPEISDLQSHRKRIFGTTEVYKAVSREQFNDVRIAAIVACRMKSTRLPKKAILPIAGVPSVERCLNQCLGILDVSQVILATSTLEEDRALEQYDCGGKVKFWTGDPEDVISRYLGACDNFGVDVILRVTADSPLVSTEIAEYLLAKHFECGADYTAASSAAVGTSCEIIETSALRTIIEHVGCAEHSEYMTWYFRNNPELFNLNIVNLPSELIRDYRLTLDHREDLEVFEELFSELGAVRRKYSLEEVFELLDSRPDISKRNAHISLRFVADQELIAMLNKKTRIRVDK